MKQNKTVGICEKCWNERNDFEPFRIKEREVEVCFHCRQLTQSGIYVREDVEVFSDEVQQHDFTILCDGSKNAEL